MKEKPTECEVCKKKAERIIKCMCQKWYSKMYYKLNKNKAKQRYENKKEEKAEYYKKNKERYQQYYQANKEKYIARVKKTWKEKQREKNDNYSTWYRNRLNG